MTTATVSAGSQVLVKGSFETTYEQVRMALKAAGFDVVADINIAELLTKKLGSYSRPYKIIVVANAGLVQRALTIAPEIGVALPINILVSQLDDDHIDIRVADPLVAWNITASAYLKPIAEELNEQLKRVISAIKK